MKCREVLFNIRENRKRELDEYDSFLKKSIDFSGKDVGAKVQRKVMYQTTGGEAKSAGSHSFTAVHNAPIDQLIEKRRSHLTLEFPFQTDTISLNQALVKSFPKNGPSKLRFPEGWAEQYFSKNGSSSEQLRQERHILDLIYRFWPKIVKEFEMDGEEVIVTEIGEAKVQDFVSDKLKVDLLYAIDQLDITEASKLIYKSRISSLFKYLLFIDSDNDLPKSDEIGWALESRLNAATLANYFEYLESRCLKKQSEDAYKDLIAIRLLFYAPAAFKNLNQVCLRDINSSKLTIRGMIKSCV